MTLAVCGRGRRRYEKATAINLVHKFQSWIIFVQVQSSIHSILEVLPVVRSVCCFLLLCLAFAEISVAQKWQPINPEELKMTSVKEAPGANAVILYKEVWGDDNKYASSEYVRIKILTEAGRKYADVELPFDDKAKRVTSISGRTIHPDGSIVNFEGKAFTKTIMKGQGIKRLVKSFTLPDVTVGSIVEYRYEQIWDEYTVYHTWWHVQDELFTKRAKFALTAYTRELDTKGGTHVFWNAIHLPEGSKLRNEAGRVLLEMENIPAFEREDNMPPDWQMEMGVYIYYGGSDIKAETFWRSEGKDWAKQVDHFVGHDSAVEEAAAKAAPATMKPGERLQKLYERAQQIRNLSFEHEKTEQAAKAEEIAKSNNSAGDVIKRGYGTHRQINRTFIALARAAGFDANAMNVASREDIFFNPGMLTTWQLTDEIAVVTVEGKDVYLDPGMKYCPYGLLDWRLTGSSGLRQIKGGETKLETVPPIDPRKAAISRAAQMEMDSEGNIKGTVTVLYQGLEALNRRVEGMDEDEAAHKKDVEDEAQRWFPAASQVKLEELSDWGNYSQPIKAKLTVEVANFANSMGSRLLVPGNVFANSYRRSFDHEQRKWPVYFHYPYIALDQMVIKLPQGMTIESIPAKQTEKEEFAYYVMDRRKPAEGYLRFDRTLMVGGILFPVQDYARLRTFFGKLKTDDDQQILLKTTETSSLGANHAAAK